MEIEEAMKLAVRRWVDGNVPVSSHHPDDFAQQVVAALKEDGFDATYEYPGYIVTLAGDGTEIHWGTVNGPWEGSVYHENDMLIETVTTNIPANTTELTPLVRVIERHSCKKGVWSPAY
jgi:hypothetical protein